MIADESAPRCASPFWVMAEELDFSIGFGWTGPSMARALTHALELAGGGHGQVVTVMGEPGVGKSRLVWEAQERGEPGALVAGEAGRIAEPEEARALKLGLVSAESTVRRWAGRHFAPSGAPMAPARSSLLFGGPMLHSQFSVPSPGTRAKCCVLLVTKVSPNERACAAMRVSNVPIGVPRRARDTATVPKRSAAL